MGERKEKKEGKQTMGEKHRKMKKEGTFVEEREFFLCVLVVERRAMAIQEDKPKERDSDRIDEKHRQADTKSPSLVIRGITRNLHIC
jgi:hypothetical protein